MAKDLHKGPKALISILNHSMSTSYQMTINGRAEFQPPKFNLWRFLDHITAKRPKLLDPRRHGDLIIEFAHYVGLRPDEWSKDLSPIAWLLKISPDIERACRKYRADAF